MKPPFSSGFPMVSYGFQVRTFQERLDLRLPAVHGVALDTPRLRLSPQRPEGPAALGGAPSSWRNEKKTDVT